MLKRTLVSVTALSLLLVAGPSSAVSVRVVTKSYTGPGSASAAGEASIHSYCLAVQEESTGGACFRIRKSDRRARVIVNDDSLEKISARVWLKGRPDITFCGATDGFFRLPRKQRQLAVVLESGGCEGEATGVPTEGTITATFK